MTKENFMTDISAVPDCRHGGHGPHDDDEKCSCACHGALGRQGEEWDPWQPEDPDDVPTPASLLAYWERANASGQSQNQLVAGPWRLWRLARDLATALKDASPDSHQSHIVGRLPLHDQDLWCCRAHAREAGAR
jgi:hypothetical protein